MADLIDKDGYHRGSYGSYVHMCPICPKGTPGATQLRSSPHQQWCLNCGCETELGRDSQLLRMLKKILRIKPTYPTISSTKEGGRRCTSNSET